MPEARELTAEGLVDRVAAAERVKDAVEAAQAHDLAAFGEVRLVDDVAERVPEHLRGRTAAIEVAAAVQVATQTAQFRLHHASRAVADHPALLGLVGSGAVSMVGLRKVLRATDVLDPDLRRVLAVDPQAAARRAAAARRHRRGVRWVSRSTGSPRCPPGSAPRKPSRCSPSWTAPPGGCGTPATPARSRI